MPPQRARPGADVRFVSGPGDAPAVQLQGADGDAEGVGHGLVILVGAAGRPSGLDVWKVLCVWRWVGI